MTNHRNTIHAQVRKTIQRQTPRHAAIAQWRGQEHLDAEAFVKTKRKLLEECDVYCIVSLPGGVFSSAGAGVKTNLVFFKKGKPTERI